MGWNGMEGERSYTCITGRPAAMPVLCPLSGPKMFFFRPSGETTDRIKKIKGMQK